MARSVSLCVFVLFAVALLLAPFVNAITVDEDANPSSFIGEDVTDDDFRSDADTELEENHDDRALQNIIAREMQKAREMGIATPTDDGHVSTEADTDDNHHALLESVPGSSIRQFPNPLPQPGNSTIPVPLAVVVNPAPVKIPDVVDVGRPGLGGGTVAVPRETPADGQCSHCPAHSKAFDNVYNFFNWTGKDDAEYAALWKREHTHIDMDMRMNNLLGLDEVQLIEAPSDNQELDSKATKCTPNTKNDKIIPTDEAVDAVLMQVTDQIQKKPQIVVGGSIKFDYRGKCDSAKLYAIHFPRWPQRIVDPYGTRAYVFWWATEKAYIAVYRGGAHLDRSFLDAEHMESEFALGQWCYKNPANDQKFSCGRVAQGLYNEHSAVRWSTKMLVDMKKAHPELKGMYLTGHGTGGALALLATATTISKSMVPESKKDEEIFKGLYASVFGAVRVGGEMFRSVVSRQLCGVSKLRQYPTWRIPYTKIQSSRYLTPQHSDIMSTYPFAPMGASGADKIIVQKNMSRKLPTKLQLSFLKHYYRNLQSRRKATCSWSFPSIPYINLTQHKKDTASLYKHLIQKDTSTMSSYEAMEKAEQMAAENARKRRSAAVAAATAKAKAAVVVPEDAAAARKLLKQLAKEQRAKEAARKRKEMEMKFLAMLGVV